MTVAVSSGAGLFGSLMDGLKDFATSILPDDFCLGCFVKGFIEGAAIGLLALAAIASAPAWLATALVVGLAVVGVIGLAALCANWSHMTGAEKSHALGNILGGLVAGQFGPKIPMTPIPGIRWLSTPQGQLIPVLVATGEVNAGAAAGAAAGVGTGALLMTGGGEGGTGGGNDEGPSRTTPTGEKGGEPTGKRSPVREGENKDSDIGENDAANVLARHGYKVEQNPKSVRLKPDYKIEGKIFDCITPQEKTPPANIVARMADKIGKGQTERIVLNMDKSNVTSEAILGEIDKTLNTPGNSIAKLKEVIIVKNGQVSTIYP